MSGGELCRGNVSRLLRYDSAILMQLSYDNDTKHWVKANGHFEVTLIVQTKYSILMTVCAVDGFKWPLTKDSAVIRMAKRTFAVVLPGLFYGLCFPPSSEDSIIEFLVQVFREYSHYLDLKELVNVYHFLDEELNLWGKARVQILPLAHDILRRDGHVPGGLPLSVLNGDSSLVRAVRMSAATRMIENAVSSGIFNLTHIIFSPKQEFISGGVDRSLISDIAYASVTVFTYVVNAVELSWFMSKASFGSLLNQMLPPLHVWLFSGLKVWGLSSHGLVTILQQIRTGNGLEINEMEQGKEKEREMATVSSRDNGKEIIVIDSEEDE